LIVGARDLFARVELTTNGRLLSRCAEEVRRHVDLLKVSLDSIREERVEELTQRTRAHGDAANAIEWAVQAGVRLAINVVLMRDTLAELMEIIEWCALVRRRAVAPVHLSLLDFYYSPSRRDEWVRGFVPTSQVVALLKTRYGEPTEDERFGFLFYRFDVDGLSVMLKDSYSATRRAGKCVGCRSYCQDGIYGLRHSYEGWLTTCPSGREDLGVHLDPRLDGPQRDDRIRSVLGDVYAATPAVDSFGEMCRIHALPG
jgi:molybdenum cofactor biosynthesis enzyme MoaA